jgi:hypothetical protein
MRETDGIKGIPIVGDVARSDPRLGFDAYATALADAIRGGSPAQFTIGIYGPWGSGKSSLLNAIAKKLSHDADIIPVLFDAWRYEGASHIIVPLLHAIYTATESLSNATVSDKVRIALLAVVRSITISLGPLSLSGANLSPPNAAEEITRLDDEFGKPYAEMRAIGQTLGNRRIAVLIDDLDRCSPEKVVSLLESINLVMDVPGFVFVLALDYDVLAKAVASRYPYASGHVFIEKMIQVPFRVPRLELPKEGFLGELIPDWEQRARALPIGLEEAVYDVATLGLEANPRQIKRLINSLLVILRVAQTRAVDVNARLLTGMVGVQLRWPAEYHDFVAGVLAGDTKPLAPLMPEDGGTLRRYSEHFFDAEVSADTFRPYLQLARSVAITAKVANESTVDLDDDLVDLEDFEGNFDPDDLVDLIDLPDNLAGSAESVRQQNRQQLVAALSDEGYVKISNSAVYFLPRNPDFRVKFGKTVIRFEVRNDEETGRLWQLGVSCLLTREYAMAIRLIRNPRELIEVSLAQYRTSYSISDERFARLTSRNADLKP